MAKYEAKVTATWWITVEADTEAEAEEIAGTDFYDNGHYDGLDDIVLYPIEEDEEEEEVEENA